MVAAGTGDTVFRPFFCADGRPRRIAAWGWGGLLSVGSAVAPVGDQEGAERVRSIEADVVNA